MDESDEDTRGNRLAAHPQNKRGQSGETISGNLITRDRLANDGCADADGPIDAVNDARPEGSHPFDALTPDSIMAAVESRGHLCDGRLLALNSYENRVYQVGIDQAQPLIAKFYRPARWSNDQILEEHRFCFELADQELPVVCPLVDGDGNSLHSRGDFRFALYPRRGGHAPELDNLDNLYRLGKMLGRMHLVGAVRPFAQRPALDVQNFGYESVAYIRQQFIPVDLEAAYISLTDDLLATLDRIMAQLEPRDRIRVHGDCHAGNMLWRDDAAHFVDFDDARMAPAIQDIWMLLSGDRRRQTAQLSEIVDGYCEFNDFEPRQLRFVEALRTLRIIHFSAWLARRWDDPAFPRAFPWFNTARYWGDHILELREQLAALQEEPLALT